MAEPKKYETKAGIRWSIKFRGPDRKPTTKRGFTTRKAAMEWWAQQQVEQSSGEAVTAAAGRITINRLGEKFLEEKVGISDATKRYYEQSLDRIERTGRIGETYVRDLRQAGVRRWVAEAVERFAAKTVQNDLSVLKQVLDQAVTDRRIRSNPAAAVKPPKGDEKEVRPITVSQLHTMAEAAGEYHKAAVLTLGLCGLRWGELVGLQVGDVDLDAGRIHVVRQKKELGGKLVDGPPKYKKKRFAPVPPPVADLLVTRVVGKASTDLVFPTRTGSPMWVGNARRDWFDPAAKAAGVELSPHALRHTYAVLSIQAGADVKTLQATMGHSSAKITLDRYGKWFPVDLVSLNTALGDLFTAGCSQNVVTDEENQPAPPSDEDEQAGH